MNWLQDDYKAPNASNDYFKLQDGDNKFRILSAPIVGWEDWINEKPVRYTMENKPDCPHDSKKPIKHFWSMIVWNYGEEKIQIMTITQATIRKSLQNLCESEDWGNPCFYDIKITRKGEGIKTEYVVTPLPHKPISSHIRTEFDEKPCFLDALFDNVDPFQKGSRITPGIWGESSPKVISDTQHMEISSILGYCDPDYRKQVLNTLKTKYYILELKNITADIYENIRSSAIANRNKYQDQLSKTEDPFGMAVHA